MMRTAEIRVKVLEDAAVIYPSLYLNQLRGEEVENRCRELLAAGIRRVVINFEDTELVNSIGISILLGVIEAVNEAGGRLALSNLNQSNLELFQLLGLAEHVRIEESEAIALSSIVPRAGASARI